MVVVSVIVEVAEGGKEGALLGLGLLEIPLLERLLIKSSLELVLVGGVLALVLALADVILVGGVLVLLGAVGDEVVGISTAKASLVLTTTPSIQAVVVKPRESAEDQSQLIILKCLHLLLCDRHQRRQCKERL